MTDAAKSRAPGEILLGEIVTTYTGRMGRKRDDFHLLRGDPVAGIAIDFRVLISFVIERSALAADRRAIGLWPIGLRSLEIGCRGLFRRSCIYARGRY